MRTFTAIICCFFYLGADAQFTDSFADGDLTQNPPWYGDTVDFQVTPSEELRLNAPSQTSSSYLSTSSQAIGGAAWSFLVRLDFDPSGSNYLDVHVASSDADPDSAKSSYFIRIGDTEDEVSLYRKKNGTISRIIDGKDGRVDMNPVTVRVQLTRSGTGDFELLSDSSGGTNYISEGSVYDDEIQKSTHFSIHCTYTSTRSDKFYLDEFQVSGSPFQDSIPPSIDTLFGKAPGELHLKYDEPLQLGSVGKGDFELGSNGAPDSINKQGGKGELILHYPSSLQNDRNYDLSIPPVVDTAGNSSDSSTIPFLYLVPDEPEANALLINEIMADPSPPVGLPEREYLELHVPDSHILNLHSWTLLVGDDSITLPRRILRPGERILVAERSDSALFKDPEGIYFNSLPALKNSGEALALYGPSGERIDSVHYRDDWYGNSDKDDGGWSLERIDPGSGCRQRMNWKASKAQQGGTPGATNSVLNPDHDHSPPDELKAFVHTEDTILLHYSEPIFPKSALSSGIALPEGPDTDTVIPKEEDHGMLLALENPLDSGRWYRVRSSPFPDCFGNRADENLEADLILPFTPKKGDVRINELLYDPRTDGEKFVECYNRSERILDMGSWQFAHYRDSVTGHRSIGHRGLLIRPGEYLFFSEDPEAVQQEYPKAAMEKAVPIPHLPTYRRDSGRVILKDAEGLTIDSFPYHEDMQHPLLQSEKGVSLERTAPDAPSTEPGTWHSAAGPEYATPGYRNSQAHTLEEESRKDRLWSDPRIFSPDLDGERDQLRVHYRFSKPGMSCSIRIHDPQGVLVKELADGELLGRKGSFVWNGTREDQTRAPLGLYVIIMECVHPDGDRILEKTTCALGTRW